MDDFVGVVILIALFAVTYACGKVVDQSEVKFDCINYGKTQINAKWYECKPVQP